MKQLAVLFGHDLADQPAIVMKQLQAARFDASARLRELSGLPTLVVSARHDRIAQPQYGRALADAIPGARYTEIAEGGHAVTIQPWFSSCPSWRAAVVKFGTGGRKSRD